jgi:Na+-transporting NADH:ubiquinone oxidoreductase subunit NqrF
LLTLPAGHEPIKALILPSLGNGQTGLSILVFRQDMPGKAGSAGVVVPAAANSALAPARSADSGAASEPLSHDRANVSKSQKRRALRMDVRVVQWDEVEVELPENVADSAQGAASDFVSLKQE